MVLENHQDNNQRESKGGNVEQASQKKKTEGKCQKSSLNNSGGKPKKKQLNKQTNKKQTKKQNKNEDENAPRNIGS